MRCHEELQVGFRQKINTETNIDPNLLKGKLGKFFILLKVFIGPKLREVKTGNFHRKAQKLVKNHIKGSKIQ